MSSADPVEPIYPGLRALLRQDLAAWRRHFPSGAAGHVFPSFLVVLGYRVSHSLCRVGLPWPAFLIMIGVHVLTGAEIRPTATFGGGLVIVHSTGVVVGKGVVAGERVSLYGANHLSSVGKHLDDDSARQPLRLGDEVVVLPHASILGAVTIGSRVVVGASSLVLHDQPDDVRIAGTPARVLGPVRPPRT